MRINKTIAREVAEKMCVDTIGKRIDAVYKEISDKLLSKIDVKYAEVITVAKRFPNFINTSKNVYLLNGCLHTIMYDSIQEKRPCELHNYINLEVSPELYEEINNLVLKRRGLEQEFARAKSTITELLYSLRTSQKIQEQFSEAVKYLPEISETTTVVAIPIEEVRAMLNIYKYAGKN